MPQQPGQIANIVPIRDDAGAIMRMFRQQAQDIQALQGAQTLNAATIDAGGCTITDGGFLRLTTAAGQVILFVGNTAIPDGSGRTQQAFLLWRDDGSAALAMADLGTINGHTHQQALVWFDRNGDGVFADDTTSGSGIASPYTQEGTFVDITPPTNTTTSTSFVAMQWADVYQQHPKLTASVLVQTPSGTTGQIRMTVGGVQIGSTVAVPSATFQQLTIPIAAWPGGSYAFQQRVVVQLEAKVVTGAGAIGVRALSLWGVQS